MEKIYSIIKKAPRLLEVRSADNVKIISIPGVGVVYVCPHPESHYSELVLERDRVTFPKKKNIK